MGLPAGTLQRGAPADVVVIDPNRRWMVDAARMRSRSRNTPFNGWELVGKARDLVGARLSIATTALEV